MARASTTWVKGQPPANPNGRPRRSWTWADLYAKELETVLTTVDGKKLDAKAAVVKRLVKMAVEGDIQAVKELTNRMDGMPKQDVTTDGVLEVIVKEKP